MKTLVVLMNLFTFQAYALAANTVPTAQAELQSKLNQAVSQSVEKYNSAAAGPKGSLTSLIAKLPRKEDRDFLAAKLKDTAGASLPKAKFLDGKAWFSHEGSKVSLEFRAVSLPGLESPAYSIFVNGKHLNWAPKDSIKKLFDEISALGPEVSSTLLDFLFPNAYAILPVIAAVAGVMAVTIGVIVVLGGIIHLVGDYAAYSEATKAIDLDIANCKVELAELTDRYQRALQATGTPKAKEIMAPSLAKLQRDLDDVNTLLDADVKCRPENIESYEDTMPGVIPRAKALCSRMAKLKACKQDKLATANKSSKDLGEAAAVFYRMDKTGRFEQSASPVNAIGLDSNVAPAK